MNPELLTPELRLRAVRVATRIVGPQDAEDVVQNAYLSALKTSHPFSGRSAVFTWFCRVTMNHSFMHLRRVNRAKEQTVDVMPEPFAQEVPADVLIFRDERRKNLLRAIDTLPHTTKADLLAVYFEHPDLTIAQIATLRGKTAEATKSNIHRGRNMLAEILASEAA